MIKSINRKYCSIKIQPKKSKQTKQAQHEKQMKASKESEANQLIKEKYLLHTFEANIQSLKSQIAKEYDDIFKLKRENSIKKIQIIAQKQFLKEKEKKVNKRQIAIFPYSGDYHKALFENEKVKQENSKLINEIDNMKDLINNTYNELEEINNNSYFNWNDTFEVHQLETYNVEILQSKIKVLSTKSACSKQKISEYQQMIKECDEKEKEILKSIDEANDKIFKFQERATELRIQNKFGNFDLKPQSIFVEFLESEVKNAEELISLKNEEIENEVNKARDEYESFISKIDEKKKSIFQKKKSVLMEQQNQCTLKSQDLFFDQEIEKKNDIKKYFSEENLNGYRKIIEFIYNQLSNRSDAIKDLNIQLQTKQVKNATNRSRIESIWKTKMKKIDFLKQKYQSIQKQNTEFVFQNKNINDLKEKSLRIDELLNKTQCKSKGILLKNQQNEEDLQKNSEKHKYIDQKEKLLLDKEKKLNEKNNLLIQKSKSVNLLEQQIQIKEKKVMQIEKEVQMLKDKLEDQMKQFENKLLVTSIHERIELVA